MGRISQCSFLCLLVAFMMNITYAKPQATYQPQSIDEGLMVQFIWVGHHLSFRGEEIEHIPAWHLPIILP